MNRPIADDTDSEAGTTSELIAGIRVTTLIVPALRAKRGGDWCEAFAISERVVALSIGDISGHGIEKFEEKMAVRSAIRTAALAGADPAQALEAGNQLLLAYEPAVYATALFGYVDAIANTLTFANAGHPAPLLSGANGAGFLSYRNADLLLGVESAELAVIHIAPIPAGALLVLFTDGVTERDRRPLHGEARLREAIIFAHQRSRAHTATIIEEQMTRTGSDHDDAAILSVWMPGISAAPSLRGDFDVGASDRLGAI